MEAVEGQSDDRTPFTSLVVIKFSSGATQDAVTWITSKITTPKCSGGAGLMVQTMNVNKMVVLHVGAANESLLLAAELMEIKKLYKDGSLREVQKDDLEQFENSQDLDSFLTLAEKQCIVKHELEAIRATQLDRCVPGMPKLQLYKGQTLVPYLVEEGIIAQLFPLHDKRTLKTLSFDWYKSIFSAQPIERIQQYFGGTVAMYFAFLGFYTMALIPPALIGLISEYGGLSELTTLFFCVFNLVWATIFLEAWKRNCATLTYKWGSIRTEHYEEARPQYYGELHPNRVTGRLEPKYPKWKRSLKFYGISLPIVLLCLFGAFYIMLVYFWSEDLAVAFHKEHESSLSSVLLYMPTIVYAVIIFIMNAVYRTLAKRLNDWENHRLQSAYDNHLVVKLVLFDFTNCFICLFYVAFYLRDMKLLRTNMAALLITQQLLGQIIESLVPYLMYKKRKISITKRSTEVKSAGNAAIDLKVTADIGQQAEIEGARDPFVGTLDDYLEMYLQFGYVFLFSAVFPTAALWALINNFTEIRTDAFKMCRTFQRPFAQPTTGIGAWQIAFELMSVMAVLTNCALLALTPQGLQYSREIGEVNYVILFIIAEHVILFVKLTLAYIIPDEPQWVETALAQTAYNSKLAWRAQQMESCRQRKHTAPAAAATTPLISAEHKSQ